MSHLKLQKAPMTWPIKRKGKTFVVKPMSGEIPILIILRDILKIAQTRKEVKRAIFRKELLLNEKPITDDKQGANLFDVLTIVPSKENYRITFDKKGKFKMELEKNSHSKIAKIKNKKMLNGKKIQINLSDGRNFLSDLKCKVNDSVVINFKTNKIEKCLELKTGAKVFVIDGKHIGESGIIEKINSEKKNVEIKETGKTAQVLIKQIMVVE